MSYALLLAQIYLRRSDQIAARQVLEPLTRASDQSVRAEAQELLESLNDNRSGGKTTRTAPPAVNPSIVAEPVPSGTSRMLSGESGSASINDGETILTSGSLPTVDQVLAKYAEAMGGTAAVDKTTSRVIKGDVDVVGVSRGGSFETYAQAPNRIITVLEAYPVGSVKTGFNGRTGWARTASGLRTLKSLELAALQCS